MVNPRVIISTDIGGKDPDDFQSLVHYLLYADILDTEGIISSPPYEGRKEHITETLKAYRDDYDYLRTWGPYPTYEQLASVTYQGSTKTGGPGYGKASEGSKRIIAAADSDDHRPLYVLVWGSMTDIAQALFDCPQIKPKIRLYSIGSWNTEQDPDSRNYVYQQHPDLWWIENNSTFRGMYIGGCHEGDLGNETFVEQHIAGHGSLGALYYSKKSDLKMGDTPSVLYIICSLVSDIGNLDNPNQTSWGGSFIKDSTRPRFWQDNQEVEFFESGKPGAKTVSRWREQFLRDWQKRMDRCCTYAGI